MQNKAVNPNNVAIEEIQPASLPIKPKRQPYKRREAKPKRNGKCPCGSGKKWKQCCEKEIIEARTQMILERNKALKQRQNDRSNKV
jgi:hypothetical protein